MVEAAHEDVPGQLDGTTNIINIIIIIIVPAG